jgi:hypothetical protein
MTSRYEISVTREESSEPIAVFAVDASTTEFRVAEIRVQLGAEGSALPAGLLQFDYDAFMAVAVALSRGALPATEHTDICQKPTNKPPAPNADALRNHVIRRSAASPDRTDRDRRQGSPSSDASTPSDLPVTYWRLGSVAKVAKHYDVPRQVASGWVKALRDRSIIPASSLSRDKLTRADGRKKT